jgi:HEAT repeat protein
MSPLERIQELPPWEWPPETRQTFLKALADRNTSASDRIIAARLAGDMVVIDADLAQLLAGIACDADEPADLRANAAIALGPVLEHTNTFEFDDPDEVYISPAIYQHLRDSLREIYLDAAGPKLVRRRALEAAVRAPEEWQKGAIAQAWNSKDPEWVLTAVFCMRFVEGFDKQILEALNNRDPDIHRHAIEAAGENGVEAAWPHIAKLLENRRTDRDLLLAAIEAAGVLRAEDAFDLLDRFTESEDEEIAEAAQEAIDMADVIEDGFEEEGGDEDESEPGERIWPN